MIDTNRYDVSYDYFSMDKPNKEIIALDNKNYPMQYTYDDKERLNQIRLPEGLTISYDYDNTGKIINAKYQLPSIGLLQSLTRKINSQKDFQSLSIHNPIMSNDGLFTQHTQNTTKDIHYTLDANNNRLSRYDNGVITTYDYQTNTDRLTHINHPDYQIAYM